MQPNTEEQPTKPTDWDELYPGRFLKAGQLGERKITLTIAEVVVDKLIGEDGKPKKKGVISFQGTEAQWALNRTNGICLLDMFGRKPQEWVGHKVTLFQGKVESGSQRGEPAIRVWGSPELERDRDVEIALPRKRPFKITLHAVRAGARKPEETREPPPPTSNGEEPPPFGP
jgi:hypothetical protein